MSLSHGDPGQAVRSVPGEFSGPGLDQLQHLGAHTAGATLTIEGRQNLLGRSFDVTILGCLAGLKIQLTGAGLPFRAIDRRAGVRCSRTTVDSGGRHRLRKRLTSSSQDHGKGRMGPAAVTVNRVAVGNADGMKPVMLVHFAPKRPRRSTLLDGPNLRSEARWFEAVAT